MISVKNVIAMIVLTYMLIVMTAMRSNISDLRAEIGTIKEREVIVGLLRYHGVEIPRSASLQVYRKGKKEIQVVWSDGHSTESYPYTGMATLENTESGLRLKEKPTYMSF